MGRGHAPSQPTKGFGGTSYAPTAGPDRALWPKTVFVHIKLRGTPVAEGKLF